MKAVPMRWFLHGGIETQNLCVISGVSEGTEEVVWYLRTVDERPEIFHFTNIFNRGTAVANGSQHFLLKTLEDIRVLCEHINCHGEGQCRLRRSSTSVPHIKAHNLPYRGLPIRY